MGRLFESGGAVDLRGRNVKDLKVTGSALIRATQWVEFLDDWSGRLSVSEPWVRFLLHATINFHLAFGVLAKRLRKNKWWTGGMTMDEQTVGLVVDAERRLAWFEEHSEEIDQRTVPPWARFLFAAIEGGYRMLVRVARETEQVLRKGHLLVAVDRTGDVVQEQNEDAPGGVGRERE